MEFYVPGISDLYNVLQGIYNWITQLDLAGMISQVEHLPDLLGQLVGMIGTIIFYPVAGGIQLILMILGDMFAHITGPITAIYGLSAALFSIVTALLSNIWPAAWVTLVATGFTIIVAVRAYHFLKDVEIAGFKL